MVMKHAVVGDSGVMQLWLFTVHLNQSTLAFRRHQNAAAIGGNRTRILDVSSATPYLTSYRGGSLRKSTELFAPASLNSAIFKST